MASSRGLREVESEGVCRPDSNRVGWVHEAGVTTEQDGNTGEAEASSSPASRIHGGFMDEDDERRDRGWRESRSGLRRRSRRVNKRDTTNGWRFGLVQAWMDGSRWSLETWGGSVG